jgi:hypothetical protein
MSKKAWWCSGDDRERRPQRKVDGGSRRKMIEKEDLKEKLTVIGR